MPTGSNNLATAKTEEEVEKQNQEDAHAAFAIQNHNSIHNIGQRNSKSS